MHCWPSSRLSGGHKKPHQFPKRGFAACLSPRPTGSWSSCRPSCFWRQLSPLVCQTKLLSVFCAQCFAALKYRHLGSGLRRVMPSFWRPIQSVAFPCGPPDPVLGLLRKNATLQSGTQFCSMFRRGRAEHATLMRSTHFLFRLVAMFATKPRLSSNF